MAEPQILVDHLAGSHRGQRQTFQPGDTIRFGRHPDSEVRFDSHRDIDASSRHADLEPCAQGHILRDVGSSNGTFVNGERVTERTIAAGDAVEIEFGAGGPRVRVYVGEPEKAPPLPRWRWYDQGAWRRAGLAAVVILVALAVAAWLVLA